MANFLDLPKPVRERIYELHLESQEPITSSQHRAIIKHNWGEGARSMPPLLRLSRKIEKEAMPFYYANNHFIFDTVNGILAMGYDTWPRHLRLVRKVTCVWKVSEVYATETFKELARYKGLQELYIRVDEMAMLKKMLWRRNAHQRARVDDPTPQQQLAILRFPGIVGLLRLSGIPHVQFEKLLDRKGEAFGGPIPGGVLETQVAAKMQAPRNEPSSHGSDTGSFSFLSLSPELRNIVYDMLLRIPGQISPSPKSPTSAPKKHDPNSTVPSSALSLLAVNRQIHDEAVGIFYHHNAWLFHYSLHLHGFLQSLGPQRQSFLRDITVHYADLKSGGMSMVELTFALLKKLTGLKRLEVVLHGELARKITCRYWWSGYSNIHHANPAMIPGMKALFDLRGVEDIQIRDLILENSLEDAKKSKEYPTFNPNTAKANTITISRALEHFNAALSEAQHGRVNRELLEDNMWQTQDEFPTLNDVDERASPAL
ncbi:hypothetical protein LTR36_002531 [Oleoguttula mirabilis]|uniref:Uncharacterized protein n=1 Tax=Oleoguttula mirabilis TaxID=1507867 RepID=A0AAV9JL76_9PEZI|nr:hypothetical protein LTR36_002531 [Oleoguttula mirabilis]